MNEQEAENLAIELVNLYKQANELKNKIKEIKGQLIEFTDLENLNDKTWITDNAYVEVSTQTKYKLAEVPAEIKISSDVAAVDIAEKAFKSKVSLTKEGKKLFNEQHPDIVKLMIPSIKKNIRIVV